MTTHAITGVYSAAATPLNVDYSPDLGLFAAHCRHLLDEGCHGIAMLGTTGEANSFSVPERRAILEGVLSAGIAPDQLMPGTGLAAVPDTVELTRHALSVGVNRVVMLPPFYYKGVSDEGLFQAYAQIIERVADDRLRIVLYHIPQVSGVPLSLALIERLIASFPGIVVSVKDSSGNFANMQAMISAFPGFSVLAGADPLLLPLLQEGGAGCITATSNLIARSLRVVFDAFNDPSRRAEVEAAQAKISDYRKLSHTYAQVPTVKAVLALQSGQAHWSLPRPPLVPLNAQENAKLAEDFAALVGKHG